MPGRERILPTPLEYCDFALGVVMILSLEGGMNTPFRFQVLQHVTALISLARPLVEAIHRADRDLASQIRRALSSTGLNDAGHARLRFRTARGSLYEAEAGIRIAIAWAHITEEQAQATLQMLDSLGARVYGLSKS